MQVAALSREARHSADAGRFPDEDPRDAGRMSAELPRCKQCGGALQRVESMPGHVVCGSGHLFVESEAGGAGGESDRTRLDRVGESSDGKRR